MKIEDKRKIKNNDIVDIGDLLVLENGNYCLVVDNSMNDGEFIYKIIDLTNNFADDSFSSLKCFETDGNPFTHINSKIVEIIKSDSFTLQLKN